MTDADQAPTSQNKRRGSVEKIAAEDLQPNLSAPDLAEEEKDTFDRAPDLENNDSKKKVVINSQKTDKLKVEQSKHSLPGHRRRNTDGALNYTPSGTKFFKAASSSAVIQLMQSELPPSARMDMEKKAKDLQNERELKKAQIRLRELDENNKTALQIISNLHKENEDLLQEREMLQAQLGAATTELKISEQKVQSLEELYRTDTEKYKEEVDSAKKQLTELEQDMTQKDIQLSEAKEYQKTIQRQLSESTGNDIDDDGNDQNGSKKPKSKKEKQLNKEIQSLKSKLIEKDGKIEKLLSQLESKSRVQAEKDNLEKEMNSLNQMARQDLEMQKNQIDRMQRELITLASRNSSLEKERDDLMNLLEERNYENQMLKTGYGLHRAKTTKMSNEMAGIANQLEMDAEYDETLENLAFMDQGSNNPYTTLEYEGSEEYVDNHTRESRSASPKHKQLEEKKEERVVDVIREYLHLTAQVVIMKFPKNEISSEELINKVRNYAFHEYHDMMIRIMKTEEQKKIQEKAKNEEKKPEQEQGMLHRFRQRFFGGGQQTRAQSKSVSNRGGRGSIAQRSRGASLNKNGRKSTTDNPAPTAPKIQKMDINLAKTKQDIAKRTKELGKKAKDLKEEAVSKMTGMPTEKEKDDMADMSFQSVSVMPSIYDDGSGAKNGKEKKPENPAKQGLQL